MRRGVFALITAVTQANKKNQSLTQVVSCLAARFCVYIVRFCSIKGDSYSKEQFHLVQKF